MKLLVATAFLAPWDQGGGYCFAPTQARVRQTLSGLRQVSILVNNGRSGPTRFDSFVSIPLFTCPNGGRASRRAPGSSGRSGCGEGVWVPFLTGYFRC